MAKQRMSSKARTGISSRATTAAKTKSHAAAEVEPKSAGLAKANRALLQEILRRKQAEAELRESVERQRAILDTIPDLAWLKDRDGRYLAVNGAWCRFIGVRAAEAVGKTAFDVHPQDFARKIAQEDRKVMRSGKALSYEELIRNKSGQMTWRETVKTPLRNRQGLVIGLAGITHDITARKKAQDALRCARSKLAGAREEERRRLSRELHDSLAQKLVALNIKLKTFAEQSSASLSDWQVASLGELSRQLQDVFGDVRYVSRTLYPPTLEPFGLCIALKQLGSDLQSHRTPVGVRCDPSLAEARFQVETEIELFRIAQEAVSNALRHGRPRRVDLSLRYAKGILRLTVVDDGKGFDTKKIFRRGLGLISMRERAEEIGGTVRITSRPGRTRVEVRAPAQKRPPASNA